jgi:hypothetical protein
MALWSLDELFKTLNGAVGSQSPPIGAGIRAFPRLGPGLLLNEYRILCFSNTNDLPEIRALVPVDCLLEKIPSTPAPCKDTFTMLSNPFLEQAGFLPRGGARLLVYQETPNLAALAQSKGWRLLANPHPIRTRWQNKVWFRRRLLEAGLQVATWKQVELHELTPKLYRKLRKAWGHKMVLQIPDFPRGGGRATFFISDEAELYALQRKWQGGRYKGHVIKEVMISPWIQGPSLSMEGCVTQGMVLCSPLQTQLLDLREVLPPGQYGRFCGHQWQSEPYFTEMKHSARAFVEWVGAVLRKEGYLGIFGLDFALDERTGELFALECNPRYTGAFPVLTLLQLAHGGLPLEAFHLMAWLNQRIQVPEELMEQTAEDLPAASQILLFQKENKPSVISGNLMAGRYRWSDTRNAALRVGPAVPLPPLPWNPKDFLIIDGPPTEGTQLPPFEDLEPLVRVIFLRGVLGGGRSLNSVTANVIQWIYARMKLCERSQ